MGSPLILLTNDDGIDAEGLRALESVLPATWEVHVVAPATVMSQCGHRITTEEHLPVRRRGPRHHSVEGTPADCVRLALTHLLPARPDWVLSGINHGGNLGADIYVSGTVAAVREAAYGGIPGIALSHYKRASVAFDWPWAAACALEAVEELMDAELEAGEHWNVNLPHLDPPASRPERVHCPPSRRALPVSFKKLPGESSETSHEKAHYVYDGVYAEREREAGSDIEVCFGGRVSVSRLRLH